MAVPHRVDPALVEAALTAAGQCRVDVADVPIAAIAAAAGISRSTLLRRLGGTRQPLDQALRAMGVDTGGRPPVRERAITAAATLIDQHGLAALTLDAVASAAECSLPSLHAVFDGRDGLISVVFTRYGPIPDLQQLAAQTPASLEDLVRAVYQVMVRAHQRQPRILQAVLADLFARPAGPASRIVHNELPRLTALLQRLLSPHISARRIRPLPLAVVIHLLLSPMASHLLLRPAITGTGQLDLPPMEDIIDIFTDAYLRAVSSTPPIDSHEPKAMINEHDS